MTEKGGSGMAEAQDPLNSLMGETLARRKSDPRFRSSVARGLDQATEHYAYPWVLGFVDEPRYKTAYLRAAGLAATVPGAPALTTATAGNATVGLQWSAPASLD